MRRLAVRFEHVGQNHGVGQAVGHAVLAAERVGDGVHVAYVRHGKRDTRFVCGVQHILARFVVVAMLIGALDVPEYQFGRVEREFARLLGG